VHREYAACIGEIFRAAGNGVDALAFDRLARLGVVLDPEQVVEAQFARGVARVAAVGPTLSRRGAVHPSPQRIVGGQTYRFPIATRSAQYARVRRVSAASSGTTYELFLQIPDGYRPMTSVPPHLSTRSACSVTTSEGAKVITASAAASNSSSVERSEELIARVAPSSSATCR
jgi:hypothetical protein